MASDAAEVVVETTAGKVRGAREHGVSAFLGIPYADDTSGPRTTPRLARYGAYHGLEIPFIFDTLSTTPHVAADPDAGTLCKRMIESWVEFARSRRPACEDAPDWVPYDAAQRATMCIDREWSLERDPHGSERAAWDDVPTGPTTRPWSRVVA